MNEWMDGWIEGLFCNRPVAFGTGTTQVPKSQRRFQHPNSDPKMLLFVVVPNNVISLLTLEPGIDYITPTSVQ